MFTQADAVRTAERLGSMVRIHDAAGDPRHPDHRCAQSTLLRLAADARGEKWARWTRDAVNKALSGERSR